MHSLSVALGNIAWVLLFKTEEKARSAVSQLGLPRDQAFFTITDDFGQQLSATHNNVHGYLLEDLDQSKLAHVERALHNARTQADANNAASSDPKLRQANMGRSPAILSPMSSGPNGGFPRS